MAVRLTAPVLATVMVVTTSACAVATPSGSPHTPSTAGPNESATPSSAGAHLDLAAVIISFDTPPSGLTSDGGRDGQVLGRLPLSADRSAELQASPGFVNGRYATFSGESGFVLAWAAQYATAHDAASAVSIVLDELQSDDGYGWGLGEPAGLGDEGTCLEGDNPREGGLHETICVWRNGPLVLVLGGDSSATPIPTLATETDARAEAVLP